jgi:hypothetical protein
MAQQTAAKSARGPPTTNFHERISSYHALRQQITAPHAYGRRLRVFAPSFDHNAGAFRQLAQLDQSRTVGIGLQLGGGGF